MFDVRVLPAPHPALPGDWVDGGVLEDVYANDQVGRRVFVAMFIDDVGASIAKLGAVIGARHPATVKHFAHQISGAAALFGATAMVRAAELIERAAQEACWSEATLQHAALERSFQMTCAELDPDGHAYGSA